jgi:sigma-E factor negative regulatory protein RseB
MRTSNLSSGHSPAILVVALTAFSAAASADTDLAQRLLNDMARAARTLNYEGTFIYGRDGELDALRIIHKADEQGERERLIALTGTGREVIRTGQAVTCILPDNQAVMVEKNPPRKLLPAQILPPVEQLAENYRFTVVGKDRIAGRPAWIVNILPRDQYRYGYQIWVDEESSLLLKSELKDERGRPLERIMFTELEILPTVPEERLEPALTGAGYTWYESQTAIATGAGGYHENWKVGWMPSGFTMSDVGSQSLSDSPMPVHHMVFSDGLATISVFIEKLDQGRPPMIGPTNIGAVNTFARLESGHQVVAVGEVPQTTVRLVANSVTHK